MKNTKQILTSQKEKKITANLAVVTSSATIKVEVKKPIRRRRHNYAKRIMNDPFIFTV